MSREITIQETSVKKEKPDYDQLSFGKHFTDHMFVMDYNTEEGWHDARITPYEPLVMDPSALVFHYSQSVFEGLKAYKSGDDVLLFRPEMNFERMNRSNERMDIPQIDVDFVLDALKKLIQMDKDWIPTKEGQSLYIRPFIIATETDLSAKPSTQYKFMIILTPVGAYYSSSGDPLSPVKIYVEDEYVRSVKGGVGFTKTGGNYAASFKAQTKAGELGYDQVLWLDSNEKKYVEEVGSMNIFFKINGDIVTPALNGSILAGITRDSVIELLKHWGYTVEERKISIEEVYNASQEGTLEEVFGTGTAAVISPVGMLKWKDKEFVVNDNQTGSLSRELYDTISGIQTGNKKDILGWTVPLEVKQR